MALGLGSALGIGASALGGLLGSRASSRGLERAMAAAQFDPWNVFGGMSSAIFDRDNKSVRTELSPEYQQLRDSLFGTTSNLFNQAAATNPAEVASMWYNNLSQLSAGDENQARLNLENRLFSQGMLGSTGGAQRMNALEDSLSDARLAREMNAWQFGQGMQQNLFNQALQGLLGMQSIDLNAMQPIQIGMGIGQGNQSVGAAMMPTIMDHYGTQANAISGLFGNLGTQLGKFDFSRLFGNRVPTPSYAGLNFSTGSGLWS